MKGGTPARLEQPVALGVGWVGAAAGLTVLAAVRGDGTWLVVRDVALAATFLAAAVQLTRRSRSARTAADSELRLWQAFALAFYVLALASSLQVLLVHVVTLPLEVGVGAAGFVAASALAVMYQGLIRWNRVAGLTGDPGDWLNGVAAVLVGVALANVVLAAVDAAPTAPTGWVLQGALVRLVGAVVVLGTVVSLAGLGGLARDRRLWFVTVALGLVVAGEVSFVMGSGDAGTARQLVLAWTVATVCISVAAAARVPAVRSRPATTLAPTVGALVVLAVAVSVALLVARGLAVAPGEDVASALGIAALLAVVAALLAGARIGRLVRDLVHLAQSRHEALTDDLTGVANRRALVTHLTDRLARGRATTLLVVDLDRFTSINDRYGHTAGDALLRFVADRLVGAVAGDGIVARLGGDEFAVVLDTSPTDPRLMGERLAVVAGSTLEIDGRRVRANASVGVAQAPEHDQVDPDELLRRADAALSRAKARGSGTDLYDEEIDRAVHERARRTDELRRVLAPFGLRGHALVVHYQPQIDLRDDTVRGVEALVRWQHPGHGLLSPAQFIDLAEQDGLMGPLTSEVLRQAARDAVQWRAVGVTLRVSVNISASFLADPDLLPLVDDVLETTGLPPADLVLEVTESTLMDDPERGLQAARAIRSRGVGLSIDDYGTGYSSLSYLRDLPATELKLDRSFTRRLLDDDRTRAIVTATADLAHRLELRLIAEGVEDEQTLAAVRELGCDEVQGFVHSRPRPAGEVLGWVQAREGTPAARSDGIGWAL